ncbi:MAG: putative exodeoxyribonuclease 8 [Prokaryotic dsDNA virus sp.]|mgnify:CR=1 FL=1|nr:MAG: putative exodeoxyribonuclease 8 [Prokaryotic dsDNA virus sp.]|tara:strand:+ start:17449 stop:18510 length:1062 start_codon:yes stop_codon:yes gene_type:complete
MEKQIKTLENHKLSFSSLNLLDYSPTFYREHILNPKEEDTTFFRKGSAVDCMLTEPDEFKNRYVVSKLEAPGGMMGDFISAYIKYKIAAQKDRDCAEDSFLEEEIRGMAYGASGFKIKFESVIKKFEDPNIQEYVNFIIENTDKTILSEDEYNQTVNMVNMLTSSEHTGKYFITAGPLQEIKNQLEFEMEYITESGKQYIIRGMIDKVIIDHHLKTIQAIDLKTTGKPVYSFESSYVKYAYYRQAAIYSKFIEKDLSILYPGYEIKPFLFIVAETACNNQPLIFKTSSEDLEVGWNGGKSLYTGKRVKGVTELISEVEWHQETKNWEIKKEVYNNSGIINLNQFKKYDNNKKN